MKKVPKKNALTVIERLYKLAWTFAGAASIFVTPAFAAGGLLDSTLATGLKNLLNDVSSFLVILSPVFGGAAAVYFLIRRSMADEQDGKLWEKRIKNAIICGAGGMLVSGVIALVTSYFTA